MAVDRAIVGLRQRPVRVEVERGRVQMFAAAIGATDPIHVDVDAARAAGHPDLVAPPTFLFGLELERADTFAVLEAHGVPLAHVLHGEQRFTYHQPVHAGDRLTLTSTFTDAYSKAGGALEFIVRHTDVRRDGDDELVLEMDNVAVVRDPGAAA
jgi:acyl dehydratase